MDATFWAPFLRITSVILGIITACSVAGAYYFERELARLPRMHQQGFMCLSW
jgi:hypothetical protein